MLEQELVPTQRQNRTSFQPQGCFLSTAVRVLLAKQGDLLRNQTNCQRFTAKLGLVLAANLRLAGIRILRYLQQATAIIVQPLHYQMDCY